MGLRIRDSCGFYLACVTLTSKFNVLKRGEKTMNMRVSFRNMEYNAAIEEYALKELPKLDKFFQPHDPTVSIELVMDVEGVDHRLYRAELRVHDKHGDVVAHEFDRDLYGVILQVIKKMYQELSKSKGRRLDLRDKPNDDYAPVRKDKADFEK